jgi:KDO2-lipid IV(A) lauroyltransferase
MATDAVNPAYKPLEPRKSRWGRPLRRWLQYWLARGMLGLAALLPVPTLQRLGRVVGRIGYRMEGAEREVCEYQLALVMPELPEVERTRLARRCFEHLGMTAVEVLAMPRLRRESERWITLSGQDSLRSAHAQGRGVIVVTAHYGNWELLPLVADLLRIPMTAVVRPLHNPRLNELLLKQRNTEFMEIAQRGTTSSPRVLLQALKNGRALILAIDQDTEAQSVYADFLGFPARTPRVAASLALKLHAPIVSVFDQRMADGIHRMQFEAVPVPNSVADAADPELALTQLLNDRISAQVRRVPEQWGWNHRRWLHQQVPNRDAAETGEPA